MIEIYLPDNNLPERRYVIDILFGEYLGLDYVVKINPEINDYHIRLENNNLLIIKDHFFSKYKDKLQYLNKKNIPGKILSGHNRFTSEQDMVILFGDDLLSEDAGKPHKIVCGNDIIAGTFFMLTRWEEFVNKVRDELGRFPATASVAKMYDFLYRPVVNEYVEFIWNILKHMDCRQKRKQFAFKPLITHDVDYILRWYSLVITLKALGADLIKKHNFRYFSRDLADYLDCLSNKKKDPFDTFDYLMQLSEENGMKSYFFFMSMHKMKHLKYYKLSHPMIKPLMDKIINRGHFIGFHPGFNTYNNAANWQREYDYLTRFSPVEINYGRQHFLQFEAPVTWQIWNDRKMVWDSTLSYHDDTGFRAGTCYPYSTFNFLTGKKLNLAEHPLIIMDKSLVMYNLKTGYDQILNKALSLLNTVKKYQGEFTLLWHNNSFNVKEWLPFQDIYTILINSCSS